MTDKELLEAYKEAMKNLWGTSYGMPEFNKHLLESKKLEETIVIRWVMMQEKEES